MTKFDDILDGLHNDGSGKLKDNPDTIEINSKRQLIIPQGYDTLLAYSGDVNSQIITFKLPAQHEGHELTRCQHKVLKWKNLTSGLEGVSNLIPYGENFQWEIPPEAFTQAGTLEISISLYDINDNNDKIAFSWNTPVFTNFSVGSGSDEIPLKLVENVFFPSEYEILTVTEHGQIVAPKGYNNTVARFGDKGISKVYFQIPKIIHGLDVSSADVNIHVLYSFLNITTTDITKLNPISKFQSAEQEGQISFFEWDVPGDITNNSENYTGNFAIGLNIAKTDKTKEWHTSPYNGLNIAPALIDSNETRSERIDSISALAAAKVDKSDLYDNRGLEGSKNLFSPITELGTWKEDESGQIVKSKNDLWQRSVVPIDISKGPKVWLIYRGSASALAGKLLFVSSAEDVIETQNFSITAGTKMDGTVPKNATKLYICFGKVYDPHQICILNNNETDQNNVNFEEYYSTQIAYSKLVRYADPTKGEDLVNKQYVDNKIQNEVQADWLQDNQDETGYVQNKPPIIAHTEEGGKITGVDVTGNIHSTGDVYSDGKKLATEEYVDEGLASKAEKLSAENSVYAYDSSGEANALAVFSDDPTAVVTYTKEKINDISDFVGYTNRLKELGHVFVYTPSKDEGDAGDYGDYFCIANKGFVNNFLKSVEINYDDTNEKITFVFKDGNNAKILDKTIDFPIEKAFVDAEYDEENSTIIFETEKGGTVEVPLDDIIGGIITPENLAQNLDGSATDKAVSQAAVKAAVDALETTHESDYSFLVDEINDKVGKITESQMAYTTNGSGNTVAKPLAAEPTNGGIPLYNEGGILKTNTPMGDLDATNKKYVEDGFVAKTNTAWRLYGTGKEAQPREYPLSSNAEKSCVAEYTDVSGGKVAYSGYLVTCDPVNPYHAANKRYVDNSDKEIRQEIDKLESIVYGSIADFVTEEYSHNPVYLPSNALTFAYINKLGTGLKEIIQIADVLTEVYESAELGERVSATSFRFNTDDYVDTQVQFAIPLNVTISGYYEWQVSIVSGSYEMQNGGILKVEDTINYRTVDLGVTFASTIDDERSYFDIFLRNEGVPVKFNNLVLKVEVRAEAGVGFEGVPICGLQIDGKTIYTVPKGIQDLKYTIPNVLGSVAAPVYGLAMSENVYNYIDFDEKKYVVRCAVDNGGNLHEVNDYIDISTYLMENDGEIAVKPGYNILFVDADGYSVGERACNTITYMTEKGV